MSKVQICNRALSMYLGANSIADIDEASPEAVQCKLHFDDIRETLLESHWWNWAKGRATLAELTNDRSSEWEFKYQWPGSALAIHWVNDAETARTLISQNRSPDTDREVIGDVIYSNVQYAVAEYTRNVDDVTEFPRAFRNAMSAALAAAIAIPITESVDKARFAQDQATMELDKAIALDERNAPPTQYQATPDWLQARGLS